MRTLVHHALSTCVAAALLAGCGGAQLPANAPGAMPQSRAIAAHADRSGSWVLPEAKLEVAPEYKVTAPLAYVTNYTFDYNDVKVYEARQKSPAPIAVISDGINSPAGDCVDKSGALYVENEPANSAGWVSEYPLGKSKPSRVISVGINTPGFCAIDRKANLWVTNIGGPNVTEYLYGSKKPHTVITKGLIFPVGIAIDYTGNLYVSNRLSEYSGNVVVYAPGARAPNRTISDGVTSPVGLATDASGTLYVTNINENNVEEYRLGDSHPFRKITKALDEPCAVVLNKRGWLYITNFAAGVVEFPPESLSPSQRQISQGLYTPDGTAYYPPLLP